MAYGAHEAKLYYVAETNYGETPTNPSMLGLKTTYNIDHDVDPGLLKLRGIGSRDLDSLRTSLRKPTLKFGYLIPSSGTIDFLQYAINLGSLSIEIFYDDGTNIIDYLYKGMKIDKLTASLTGIEGDEAVVKAEAELLGQDVVISTAKIAGATYNDYTNCIPFSDCMVKKAGVTLTRVTDWTATIANNLRRVPVIRSTSGNLIKYLQPRHRDLSGEVTFEFESKEEHDQALAGTEFWLEFFMSSNKIQMSNAKWENVKNAVKVEDLVAVKAPFVAKSVSIT